MMLLFLRRVSHRHTLIFEERGILGVVRERTINFPHNTKVPPVPDHVIASRPISLEVREENYNYKL